MWDGENVFFLHPQINIDQGRGGPNKQLSPSRNGKKMYWRKKIKYTGKENLVFL